MPTPAVQSERSPAPGEALPSARNPLRSVRTRHTFNGNRGDPRDSRWRVAEGRHANLARPSRAGKYDSEARGEILPVGADFSAARPWRRSQRPPCPGPGIGRDPFVRAVVLQWRTSSRPRCEQPTRLSRSFCRSALPGRCRSAHSPAARASCLQDTARGSRRPQDDQSTRLPWSRRGRR